MTSTAIALPTSVVPASWDANTAALMEFAGLTWLEAGARKFAPTGVMAAFIQACQRTQLDPTTKQIYAVQMGGKWTVLVGVDGMRLVAQRSGEYDGSDPIEWQWADLTWHTEPPAEGNPHAARISIYRKGISRPTTQTVTFKEFGGRGGNWQTRPGHMLGIRAETHALRRLFPMELSGLYTAEDLTNGTLDGGTAITVEPTEDWAAKITAAQTIEELSALRTRAQGLNEYPDSVHVLAMARFGEITRAAAAELPEIVVDVETGEVA